MEETLGLSTLSARAAADYARDGFYIVPTPVVPAALVAHAAGRMDAVYAGEYETGVEPLVRWRPEEGLTKIRQCDEAHLADRTIFELVTHPAIGAWAAALTGAKWVQLWALQMLYKPSGGDVKANVGWHQDQQYWRTWWEEGSEVFTVWLAVSDVREECGPMHFVSGSHRWGFQGGDFYAAGDEAQRAEFHVPAGERWEEVPAVLPPGGMSFHHRLTLHGSRANCSSEPRRSFALHLRTEKSRPLPTGSTVYYLQHLDDPTICPVLFNAER